MQQVVQIIKELIDRKREPEIIKLAVRNFKSGKVDFFILTSFLAAGYKINEIYTSQNEKTRFVISEIIRRASFSLENYYKDPLIMDVVEDSKSKIIFGRSVMGKRVDKISFYESKEYLLRNFLEIFKNNIKVEVEGYRKVKNTCSNKSNSVIQILHEQPQNHYYILEQKDIEALLKNKKDFLYRYTSSDNRYTEYEYSISTTVNIPFVENKIDNKVVNFACWLVNKIIEENIKDDEYMDSPVRSMLYGKGMKKLESILKDEYGN